MNDQLAASLSTLVGALATAVLMAAAYYWGPRQTEQRRKRRDERTGDDPKDE